MRKSYYLINDLVIVDVFAMDCLEASQENMGLILVRKIKSFKIAIWASFAHLLAGRVERQ